MVRSMTGYGSAECVSDGVSYALEIRTLNHRYLKLSQKLPETLQHCENALEKAVRERIARGAVYVSIRIRGEGAEIAGSINRAAAQQYVDQLGTLTLPDGVSSVVDLAALALLPGVCEPLEVDEALREKQEQLVRDLARRGLDELLNMRRTEGIALGEDILQTCGQIREHMHGIQQHAHVVIDEYHDRLREKVNTLMNKGGFELEQDGLMREVAIYAERCDVSEEITRLAAHLEQFGNMCQSEEPVGRTLEFLAQELLREATTIGSKSNDNNIAQRVVSIKGLIDRLKEQVQNVE